MNTKYNLIGVRIKYYRELKGLSQEELGDIIDTSNRHLSKVETGVKNPSLELVIKISNALDITADDLLANYLTGITHNTELAAFFNDCTPTEKTILMDMLKHMKALLLENGI